MTELEIVKRVERPKCTQIIQRNGRYYVVSYTSKRMDVFDDNGVKIGKSKPKKVSGPLYGQIEKIAGEWTFTKNQNYINLLNNFVEDEVNDKEYGGAFLCKKYGGDLFISLNKIFSREDSLFLLIISFIKLLYVGSRSWSMEKHYEYSFLSEYYPEIGLSKNNISLNLEKLGTRPNIFEKFMYSSLLEKSKIVIDGTLTAANITTNPDTVVGRKDKGVYHTQLNLVYLYDFEAKEPRFFRNYAGNINDITAFNDIYKDLNLKNGIIVGDRMFGSTKQRKQLTTDGIKYLFPLKTSDLKYKATVLSKNTIKEEVHNGKLYEIKYVRRDTNKYLIGFRDVKLYHEKIKNYQEKIDKKQEGFTKNNLIEIIPTLAYFVFEANFKMSAKDCIEIYEFRWMIETFFDDYKNELELDLSNSQGRLRANTQLFINHLTMLTYCKIKKDLSNTKDLQYKNTRDMIESFKNIRTVKRPKIWELTNLTKARRKQLSRVGFDLRDDKMNVR